MNVNRNTSLVLTSLAALSFALTANAKPPRVELKGVSTQHIVNSVDNAEHRSTRLVAKETRKATKSVGKDADKAERATGKDFRKASKSLGKTSDKIERGIGKMFGIR